MKALKTICFTAVLLVGISIFVNYEVACAEVDYLGEFCFSMDSRVEGTPRKNLQLGVLSFGNQHYPAHGRIAVEDRAGLIPVHGVVVKDGDDVVITLSGSDHGKGSDSFRIHAIIDGNPGSYNTIEHLAVPEPGSSPSPTTVFHDFGDITVIPCP